MLKALRWHVILIIMIMLATVAFAQSYKPDSIRIITLPATIYNSSTIDSMVISNLERARADKYNYARIYIPLSSFYWWYWGYHGTLGSPYFSNGANVNTMTSDASARYTRLIQNAFKQMDKYGIKFIPGITLGQHGWIYGWGMLSDSISWNYKRFDSLTRNVPLTHASGYPLFQKSIGTSSMIGSGFFYADSAPAIRPISIKGFGKMIKGTSDTFHFVFRDVPINMRNFSFVTRVDSIQNTNDSARAGAMIRENLNAGSSYAMICVTRNNGIWFQYRQTNNGNVVISKRIAGISCPCKIKIERDSISPSTDKYIGWDSAVIGSNQAWHKVDSINISMSQSKGNFLGLAVASGLSNTTICSALFSQDGWPLDGNWGQPIASTPCGADPGKGGFDKVFSNMLTIYKNAFNGVKSQLHYNVLDFIDLGYDETISTADTAKAYLMVGESKVDSAWIKSRLDTGYSTDTLQKTVQKLISFDLRRRVDTLRSSIYFGTGTKAMIWADMWDKNAYDGKASLRTYFNPLKKITTAINPGIVATADAQTEKNNIILSPWNYANVLPSAPGYYNTFDTYNWFKTNGFKIIFNWAISDNYPMVQEQNQLKEVVNNNWLNQFKNTVIGYSVNSYELMGQDPIKLNAFSMDFMFEWTYFAPLLGQ